MILFALAAGRVDARIGESQAAIEKRYGPPFKKLKFQKPIDQKFNYHFAGFVIEVSFIQDHAVMELFERDDRGFISEEEIAALLKANEAGLTWHREESSNTEREYRRTDGGVVARLNAFLTKFMIAASDSDSPSEKVDGKTTRKKLDGF